MKNNKTFLIPAMSLLAIASTIGRAEEFARATDPITVKPGEEFRVTLYNPHETPITMKVFVYNALETNYDESPSVTLAPGRLRFFDFKAPKEFVGLVGIIEVAPDATAAPASSVAAGTTPSKDKEKTDLTNTTSYDFRSRSGIQVRGPAGQAQTLGFSWGASMGGWQIRNVVPASTKRTQSSNWIQSAEY